MIARSSNDPWSMFILSNGLEPLLSHIVFNFEFLVFIRVKYCFILEFASCLERPRDRTPGFESAPSAAAEIYPKLTRGSRSPDTESDFSIFKPWYGWPATYRDLKYQVSCPFLVTRPFILPKNSKIVLIFIPESLSTLMSSVLCQIFISKWSS